MPIVNSKVGVSWYDSAAPYRFDYTHRNLLDADELRCS